MTLLGMSDDQSLELWSNRLFSTFDQFTKNNFVQRIVPEKFKMFQKYFFGGSKHDLTIELMRKLVTLYTENLQAIILGSPPLKGNIRVYKASSPYPGLEVGKVHQVPFNSTSYRVDINFSTFLPPEGLCCMHEILIEKGK